MQLDDFAGRFCWLDAKRPPASPLAAMKPSHELDQVHISHPVWNRWLQEECRNLPFLEPDSPVITAMMITAMALYAMPNTTRKHSQHGNITLLDFAGGGRALAPSMILAPDPDLERHLVSAGNPEAHSDLALAAAIAGVSPVTILSGLADMSLSDQTPVSSLVLDNIEHAPDDLAPLLMQIMPCMTWGGRILFAGHTDAVTHWHNLVQKAGGQVNCLTRFDWRDAAGQQRSFSLHASFADSQHRHPLPETHKGDIWRAVLFEDLADQEKTCHAPAQEVDIPVDMIIHGGPNPVTWTPPTITTLPPMELAYFTNAVLFGYGMVATEDGRLFAGNMRAHDIDLVKQDSRRGDIGANLWHNRLTPVAPGHYKIGYDLDDFDTITEPAFLAGFQAGGDYTHFFWDVLPRLHLLKECPATQPLVILTGSLSGWQREVLIAVGITPDRIICQGPDDRPRRFDQLWVPSFLGTCNHAIRQEGIAILQSLKDTVLAKEGPGPSDLPKRLFLTRKTEKAWIRRHLNERAIEAQLANHGFIPVDTAELTLTEKIQLFDQAEFLAGAYGGAWAHNFFCRPGTKLMPFSTVDYPAPGGAVLGDVMGFPCKTVIGDTLRTELDPSNSPYLIDPSAVDLALQELGG